MISLGQILSVIITKLTRLV